MVFLVSLPDSQHVFHSFSAFLGPNLQERLLRAVAQLFLTWVGRLPQPSELLLHTATLCEVEAGARWAFEVTWPPFRPFQ